MDIFEIPQFARNAGRFREVVTILAKHGLADWLSAVSPDWLVRFRVGRPEADRAKYSIEQRIRVALIELGTTFIKLGQVLSTRPDLVGRKLSDELAQLRADTPADAPEVAIAMIESELGGKVSELFAMFEATAMASASIGQVHCATTHAGQKVVVKVQHAGIERRIVNDLEIMVKLAELADQHSAYLRQFQPEKTTREFQKTLMQELDFGRELRNMLQFRKNFSDDKGIRFATPHAELSSRRVLTMERFEGIHISEKHQLEKTGCDVELVARRGANLFIEMIFRDGFYHADPHPGNLLVLADASGAGAKGRASTEGQTSRPEIIGVLDCGMVGRIDGALREEFELALIAASRLDATAITEIVARVGEVPSDFDEPALLNSIQELLDEYHNQSIDTFDLSRCLNEIIAIIRNYKIFLPAKVAMLLKVLVVLEGTIQQLSPKFSLVELIEPYGEKAMHARFSPNRIWGRWRAAYQDWDRLITILPKDIADILHNVKRGKFDVHLDHRRLEPIVNRLVMGILTAALFMGSAALCSNQVPPSFYGYSIPGVLGCGIALFMGWSITRAIRRSKHVA